MQLLFALTPAAFAWSLMGGAWSEGQSHPELSVTPGDPATLPGRGAQVIGDAAAAWTGLDCVPMGLNISAQPGVPGNLADGLNSVSFEDPDSALGAGVLAVTTQRFNPNDPVKVLRGETLYAVRDADVVFNDNVAFADQDGPDWVACDEEYSLRAVATHELGHLLGLGHSCERGQVCGEDSLRDASMFWTVHRCDGGSSSLGSDDRDGLFSLYGPEGDYAATGTPSCDADLGPAPLTVQCLSGSPGEASWDMGDETVLQGAQVQHRYEGEGVFRPQVCATFEQCPDFEHCQTLQPITSCQEPAPRFTARRLLGRGLLLENGSLGPPACIDSLLWTVEDQSGELLVEEDSWHLALQLPEAGDYVVTLRAEGVAGTGVFQELVTWTETDEEGVEQEGCSTAPLPRHLWLTVALLLLWRRR